jgi:hypothetical protein
MGLFNFLGGKTTEDYFDKLITFTVDNISREVLAHCKTVDYVNLWVVTPSLLQKSWPYRCKVLRRFDCPDIEQAQEQKEVTLLRLQLGLFRALDTLKALPYELIHRVQVKSTQLKLF